MLTMTKIIIKADEIDNNIIGLPKPLVKSCYAPNPFATVQK